MGLKPSILLNWSWHSFGPSMLVLFQTMPKHRLGINLGQGPSAIGILDVATVIWRVREFSCVNASSFMPVGLQEKSLTNFI